MGTAQLAFEVERCGGATRSHVTGSDMTGSDVGHVTRNDNVRKYVLRMRNRKLRNTRSSSKQCWLGCSLRHPRLIFTRATGTKRPRLIFSMVIGTSLGYLPLLFSYSV